LAVSAQTPGKLGQRALKKFVLAPEVSRGDQDGKTARIGMRTPAWRRRHDHRGVIVGQEVAAF
jgi:hypothetical protein